MGAERGVDARDAVERLEGERRTAWRHFYEEQERANALEAMIHDLGQACGVPFASGLDENIAGIKRQIQLSMVRPPRLPLVRDLLARRPSADRVANLAGIASARSALKPNGASTHA